MTGCFSSITPMYPSCAARARAITPRAVQETRTQLAIRHALSQMTTGRAARILALTDGYSTEPLGDIAERLIRQRVSLDYRLVTPPLATDYGDHRPAPARPRATG